MITLYRTLVREHRHFLRYSVMPAWMWRHGIHTFFELPWHRFPESLDHRLTFIYLAYSMMTLLHETVPAFEDTWIECLGDLGRYGMAIEDDDIRDRDGSLDCCKLAWVFQGL